MKKKMFQISDMTKLASIRTKINNSLTEKGSELKEALLGLLDEIEQSEVEYDESTFKAEVEKVMSAYGEVPAAVADAIAKKMVMLQNMIGEADTKKELSVNVKNQISSAILRSGNKTEIENSVKSVLVKNDITGLVFGDVIDFTIATKWEDLNPLLAKLKKVFYTKFHYSTDEMLSASIFAKGWAKGNAATQDKLIQELAALSKTITTKYVYKRQQVAFEDLDEIEQAGEQANFLRWLNEELDVMIANSIIATILIGDQSNLLPADKITTFESIGTKVATDVFTVVENPTVPGTYSLEDVRRMCDAVKNPNGKEKVLVISQAALTTLSAFTYAAGGSTEYRSREVMAEQFGVNEVVVTDVLAGLTGVHSICFIPDGYWFNEKKALSVVYPTYEKNLNNYQKERNVGGAIHDLFSSGVLKAAAGA